VWCCADFVFVPKIHKQKQNAGVLHSAQNDKQKKQIPYGNDKQNKLPYIPGAASNPCKS
jgi:hypothetical protein